MCGAAVEKNQAGNIKRMKNGMKKLSERASEAERQWPRPTRQAQGPTKGQRQTGRLIDRAYICLTQHKNESKSYKKKPKCVRACVCTCEWNMRRGKTLRTSLAGAQKDSSMAIPKLQAKVWTSSRMMRRVQSKHKYGTSRRRGTLTIPTLSPQRGLSQEFLP